MKRFSFRTKVLLALIVFAALLSVVTCLSVGSYYKRTAMEQYREIAFGYAKAAAEFIDGDRIEGYDNGDEIDDYHHLIMDYLNSARAQDSLLYYYVQVPHEDYVNYIWDADTFSGSVPFGYHEAYGEGDKERIGRIMAGEWPEELFIGMDSVYGYSGSAFYPLRNSAGEAVAVVGVDLSMKSVNENLARFQRVIVICVAVSVALLITVLFLVFNQAMINPIKNLTQAAQDMAGKLEQESDFTIQIKTGDELDILANSFNQMYTEIQGYVKRLEAVTAERERIGAELSVATHIQSSMLPNIFPPFPDRPEFEIFASMTPAKEVGGDFYDFFMVDERHLAVVMADVSGKGVPASLFMVIGKTLIKDHSQIDRDLGKVFTDVNDLLCDANGEHLFITAFEGVLDLVTGEFAYVNAGHEVPYLSRGGEQYVQYEIPHGLVLAGLENIQYKQGSLVLEPGDKLFLYTDGIPEATDRENQLYGFKRLERVLARNRNKRPTELLPLVKEDVDAFVGTATQFDDLTMLCLEYTRRMEEAKNV